MSRVDFGLFLLLACCSTLAGLTWNDYKGYSSQVSDWGQIDSCDYSTNRYCYWFYNRNKHVGYFRLSHIKQLEHDLVTKNSLIVGLDYYALMGTCRGMVPVGVINKYGHGLMNGKVYKFKIKLKNNLILWEDLNE